MQPILWGKAKWNALWASLWDQAWSTPEDEHRKWICVNSENKYCVQIKCIQFAVNMDKMTNTPNESKWIPTLQSYRHRCLLSITTCVDVMWTMGCGWHNNIVICDIIVRDMVSQYTRTISFEPPHDPVPCKFIYTLSHNKLDTAQNQILGYIQRESHQIMKKLLKP